MNYKETLLFVAKCLTITLEKTNRNLVEDKIKSGLVNWDDVVKISTAHYVFPALYCNLERVNFLHYLPADLVEYMKHITDLNRERNQQIIKEAKEINDLLLSNNITPIFLKGTGNLLEGLYEDIAERMVGDIDFLVHKNHLKTTFNILKKHGYINKISELFDDHRHIPRITHPEKIAAVEIHKNMLRKEKAKFFDYKTIKDSLLITNNIAVLSIENQIKLTVFSKLINDNAYFFKSINLRGTYDVFLLGNKLKSETKITDTNLSKELSAGLDLYSFILSKPLNLQYASNNKSQRYTKDCLQNLTPSRYNKVKKRLLTFYLKFFSRLQILVKALFNKSYFKFVFSRATDINWYKRKLGLKPNP
ncbi:nucleotidyltransferase domain-containing protein [Tenacibaculum caenipelagi]|uniref:Putative nucleotidyltransferase-like protein n=1 Tax=Tenacibaculum caenipelagi TaxID=1325435 RepID=A0A4R6THJ2_9FLAO|nr:nucleotidyltransferase family protein [Tenacibaculum caenipelagi]TDQ30063.1 putative nucleotidyltransferase-like protein [Tenacibaculum caenipelagi]